MREAVVVNGYEQAAAYWRERAEAAEAELAFLKEEQQSNAQIIAHAMRIPMQPASCLEILMRKAPAAVSRQHITNNMSHHMGFEDRSKLTDVVVCKLRKLLRARGFPNAIQTVWGFGYALDSEVAQDLINEVLTEQGAGKDALTIRNHSLARIPSTDKKMVAV